MVEKLVLIIYSLIPDKTLFYIEEYQEWMDEVNGYIVNCSPEKAASDKMVEFLEEKRPVFDSSKSTNKENTPIDFDGKVIYFGFII